MKKYNYRLLLNSLISIFIIIGVVLLTQISMSNPKQFCYVAINDKYLVFTDSLRNKVTVYTPDDSGKWQKTKEILPPADLDLSLGNHGSAFGTGLELDGDVLTISARTKNPEWLREGLSQAQRKEIPQSLNWRYITNLETQIPLKQIDLLVEPESESNRVRFNLLRQGKIEQFILPNMSEERFGSNSFVYGQKVALDRDLLLVGYSSPYDSSGGAWLFNLAQPQVEPIKITRKNAALGSTVAVSQKFAVIGFHGVTWRAPRGNPEIIGTLIKNLDNSSTTSINSFGEVSLSDNILAVMRPGSPEDNPPPLLKVFRLDEDTKAHLITRRTNVGRGRVQNGFLITSQFYDSNKVCIEPLPLN